MSMIETTLNAPSRIPTGAVIADLLADAREAVAFDRFAARLLLARAIEILDSAPEERRSGGLAGWQLRRLDSFIADHLSATITLEGMAACVRLSPSHFGRAFKATVGETPHAHVLRSAWSVPRNSCATRPSPWPRSRWIAAWRTRATSTASSAGTAEQAQTPGGGRLPRLRPVGSLAGIDQQGAKGTACTLRMASEAKPGQ